MKTWVRTGNSSRETFRKKIAENKPKTALGVLYASFMRPLRLLYDSAASPTPRTFQL